MWFKILKWQTIMLVMKITINSSVYFSLKKEHKCYFVWILPFWYKVTIVLHICLLHIAHIHISKAIWMSIIKNVIKTIYKTKSHIHTSPCFSTMIWPYTYPILLKYNGNMAVPQEDYVSILVCYHHKILLKYDKSIFYT